MNEVGQLGTSALQLASPVEELRDEDSQGWHIGSDEVHLNFCSLAFQRWCDIETSPDTAQGSFGGGYCVNGEKSLGQDAPRMQSDSRFVPGRVIRRSETMGQQPMWCAIDLI
jgi:hypothetical protein